MGKIVYLDPIGGIAGDMFTAAFLDAGVVDLNELQRNVSLVVPEVRLEAEQSCRSGIQGTKLRVISPLGEELPGTPHSSHGHELPGHQHSHFPYRDICHRLSSSSLDPAIKNLAGAIFEKLAKKEAHVHGKKVEDVAFHEVGRNDAIADIVCAAVSIHALGQSRFVCGPIPFGQGIITFSHGTMSVPAPAVLEILKGIPTIPGYPVGEMTTPTGAAIAVTCSSSFQPMPALIPRAIGYGHGSRNPKGYPSSLRVIIGEELSDAGDLDMDEVIELTANIDDQPPHLLAPAIDLFLKEGALDAFFVPYIGKKGRQGQMWSIIARLEDLNHMVALMMSELGTIGVRTIKRGRYKLKREETTMIVEGEEVRAKRVYGAGIDRTSPEADELIRIAREKGKSLIEVASKFKIQGN